MITRFLNALKKNAPLPLLSFIFAFFIGGIIIVVSDPVIIAFICFIPAAKRNAHSYRLAHHINKVSHLLYGPVPYASILTVPVFATILVFLAWMYVRAEWFEFSLPFGAGIFTSVFFAFLSSRDKNGKRRRTFNLSWGSAYSSELFKDSPNASLVEEQLYQDLPDELKDARKRLLSNDGEHESTPRPVADINLLSEKYGIVPDASYGNQDQCISDDFSELASKWKKNLFLKEEAYIIPKALLRLVLRQKKDGKVMYSFNSTI